MGTKMKEIFKEFKYTISQMFVVKEREMEIGYPTDVKHVAHIGWDGQSGNAPSWMNEFKTGPDFETTSMGNSLSPWSSQDFNESTRHQSGSEILFNDMQSPEPASSTVKKKQINRKKNKSSSSAGSCSSSRSARFSKPKSKLFTGDHPKHADIRVV